MKAEDFFPFTDGSILSGHVSRELILEIMERYAIAKIREGEEQSKNENKYDTN